MHYERREKDLPDLDFVDTLPSESLSDQEVSTSDAPVDQGRRGFLASALKLGGAIALGATIGAPYTKRALSETLDREEVERALSEVRGRLRTQHGIEVDFGPTGPEDQSLGLSGEVIATATEKLEMCRSLERAFVVYPQAICKKRTIISRVRVLDELTDAKKGRALGSAHRPTGDMYINRTDHQIDGISFVREWRQLLDPLHRDKRVRETVHHELWHLLDTNDEQAWDREARGLSRFPPARVEELPYLYDNELSILVEARVLTEKDAQTVKKMGRGFVTPYARVNSAEDRATVAEYLFTAPQELLARSESDDLLAQKTEFMTKQYFLMSHGVMDDAYWMHVASHPEDPDAVRHYVKKRARELLELSYDEYRAYIKERTGIDCTDAELINRKNEIALDIGGTH